MDRKRRLMENNNGWPLRSQLLDGAPFRLPLTNTAVPASAASGTTATFTRATTKTWPNNDGYLVTGLSGEIGFPGARRVDNLVRLGAAQSSTLAVAASVTMTLPAGAYQFSMGAGTGTATFSGTGGATGTLAASASGRTFVAKTISAGTLIVTGSVATLVDIQVVSMVAETDQTTIREYVSVGVASAPYFHGSFVDGVRCYSTALDGSPIPSTTLLGYSAEGARTNLCLQSNAFTTAPWSYDLDAVSQNAIGPDGAVSAWTTTDSSAVAAKFFQSGAMTLTAAPWTTSIFVKKTSGATSFPVCYMVTGYSVATITIDTNNGIATPWTAYTGLTIVPCTTVVSDFNEDYWRVAFTFTATAAVWAFTVYVAGTTNATQSTGTIDTTAQGSAVFYGAQVELGSFASSYIATTTIAVARNADVLTYSSSGNVSGTVGTVYCEASVADFSNTRRVFDLNTGGTSVPIYYQLSNGFQSFHDGTAARSAGVVGTAGVVTKLGLAYGGAEGLMSKNGTNQTAQTFDGSFGTITDFSPGGGYAAGQEIFGNIRNVRIWQRALSSSELQAVTA